MADLIRFFLKHSRKAMIFSLFAGILSGASNAALLAVINSVLKGSGTHTGTVIWIFMALCLVLPVSRFVSELLLNKLGQGALYSLRMELCSQILSAPLRHLEQISAARLIAALTEDVPNITNAILVMPLFCINMAVVIGCLIYMSWLSWVLLMVVMVFMAIGIVTYQLPIIKAQKVFRLARQDSDAMQEHFRALTQGTKELKMHSERRCEFLNEILGMTAVSFRKNNIAATTIYSAASSWGQTLVFVVIGLIVFTLPKFEHINGLTLTGYAIALLYLMTPLQVIMNMIPSIGRANVALNKVRELGFSLTSQGDENVPEVSPPAPWRTLEFQSVTHTYFREGELNNFVIGPLDLSFVVGEMVFITGGNGMGKTTLAKLLTGLYIPEQGGIYLDGQSINSNEKRERYRQYFSVIFADFYLFNRLMGLPDRDLNDDAKKYLAQLKLSDKVSIQDRTLSTVDLSHGQRKRLALLTAYLEDRPIYLFDEWAADQDPYFKNIFYAQLLPDLKAKGKTIFVITHDDRYYHVADRIIKLEDGCVVSDRRPAHEQAPFQGDEDVATPAARVTTR